MFCLLEDVYVTKRHSTQVAVKTIDIGLISSFLPSKGNTSKSNLSSVYFDLSQELEVVLNTWRGQYLN